MNSRCHARSALQNVHDVCCSNAFPTKFRIKDVSVAPYLLLAGAGRELRRRVQFLNLLQMKWWNDSTVCYITAPRLRRLRNVFKIYHTSWNEKIGNRVILYRSYEMCLIRRISNVVYISQLTNNITTSWGKIIDCSHFWVVKSESELRNVKCDAHFTTKKQYHSIEIFLECEEKIRWYYFWVGKC